MERRIITTDVIEEDLKTEGNLRPQLLVDYIGQEKAKENLKVYIEAAKQRNALTLIEAKCAIGAREDLGRPTTAALENKENFMKYLQES